MNPIIMDQYNYETLCCYDELHTINEKYLIHTIKECDNMIIRHISKSMPITDVSPKYRVSSFINPKR